MGNALGKREVSNILKHLLVSKFDILSINHPLLNFIGILLACKLEAFFDLIVR